MMKNERVKNERQANLEEKRHEYMEKMEIINEIKREKQIREEQAAKKRLKLEKQYADAQKVHAQAFKSEKEQANMKKRQEEVETENEKKRAQLEMVK